MPNDCPPENEIVRLRPGQFVPLPSGIRGALASVFGDGVDNVCVVEHSWFARLHGRAVATTRRRRVYLRGSAADFFRDPALMLHEYCHVLLQWEPGLLTTRRYVYEWLKRGYRNNRFEIDARRFERAHLQRFQHLLASRYQAE